MVTADRLRKLMTSRRWCILLELWQGTFFWEDGRRLEGGWYNNNAHGEVRLEQAFGCVHEEP